MIFQEPAPTRFDLGWRMLGMPVRVSPWFWAVGLVLGWSALQIDPVLFLLWTACLFVSILVHELGHALTARAFGARGIRVVLYAMGGLAIHDGGGLSRRQRVIELLMGPGAGFLLYGLLWAFELAVEAMWPGVIFQSLYLSSFLAYISWICLWWGLVNLLPVFPLDGGQIARELCVAGLGRERGVRSSLWISIVAGGLIAAAFALWHLSQGGGVDLGLYPALLFGALAVGSYQQLRPMGGYAASVTRELEPWQRDPDWWKG